MTDSLHPSPMLTAIDLIRVRLDGLRDDELDEHAIDVVDVLMELEAVLAHAVCVSSIAAANVARLLKRLRAHLAQVRDLIEQRRIESAEDGEEGKDEPSASPHATRRRAAAIGRPC
ncbi:MAG: hypothetical protein M3N82_17610 [Pseudomonadota bacterium]|nr:hypothetical protein [Pseudomonadota bacterium]